MMLNNIESELLPAHLEEIIHDDGVTERHTYFSPNGLAIEYRHPAAFSADVLGGVGGYGIH